MRPEGKKTHHPIERLLLAIFAAALLALLALPWLPSASGNPTGNDTGVFVPTRSAVATAEQVGRLNTQLTNPRLTTAIARVAPPEPLNPLIVVPVLLCSPVLGKPRQKRTEYIYKPTINPPVIFTGNSISSQDTPARTFVKVPLPASLSFEPGSPRGPPAFTV